MLDVEEKILRIYDILNDRLKENGMTMAASRDAYAEFVHNKPGDADYNRLEELNVEDFQSAVFCTLLQRPVEDNKLSSFYSFLMKRDPEEYRQNLLVSVLLSEEFKIKKPILRNAFVLEPYNGKIKAGKTIARLIFSLAHSLPDWLKNFIKTRI